MDSSFLLLYGFAIFFALHMVFMPVAIILLRRAVSSRVRDKYPFAVRLKVLLFDRDEWGDSVQDVDREEFYSARVLFRRLVFIAVGSLAILFGFLVWVFVTLNS